MANNKPWDRVIGFVAASGNFGFDFEKKDVSNSYIITCVLVEKDNIEALEVELDRIRQAYFQKGEIKSLKVSSNNKRRKIILKELIKLDFKIFTLVVDKRKIYEDSGLIYKRSFVKYLNGLFYNELTNYYPKLELHSQEFGSNEFMDGFKKYLQKNHIPNLFGEYNINFIENKGNLLIQVADFISGTLAYGFEENRDYTKYLEYHEIIKDKLLPIIIWPIEWEDYIKRIRSNIREDFDCEIAYTATKTAVKFMEKYKDTKSTEIMLQVMTLRYLLNMLATQGKNEYISSGELLNHISFSTGKYHTSNYFQSKIIAPLRDAGILIATSNRGYKIPINEKEIISFVNQTSSMIKPMINRVGICRDQVLKATNNRVDVFDYKEFKYIEEVYK